MNDIISEKVANRIAINLLAKTLRIPESRVIILTSNLIHDAMILNESYGVELVISASDSSLEHHLVSVNAYDGSALLIY